jgi:autotransporter-associated beta strand protein
MKPRYSVFAFRSLLLIPAILVPSIHAADLYWNPSPLSDDWANTVWADSSGGAPSFDWFFGDNAIFDQADSYTVTINADQTALDVNVLAGDVTFTGTHTVSSDNVDIASGATLTADGDRFLKVGTTNLNIDGNLNITAPVSAGTRRVAVTGGSGNLEINGPEGATGSLRLAGDFNFAGNISGNSGILTEAAGNFTFSGNNTYTGNTLLRNGNILRLDSATALSPNTLLRFGGGANIVELAAGNFSRSIGTEGGDVQFQGTGNGSGSAGFAAVNADRTVALNNMVPWGTGFFQPNVLHLGSAASTHKVNLTTGLDLNGASRTINTTDGPADVEAEITGVISGTGASRLIKTGTGVLHLSGPNTYEGGTEIANNPNNDFNSLRISHAEALGTGVVARVGGGNTSKGRLELMGGITITNTFNSMASRGIDAAPSILNLSGTNTITSNISAGSGGDRTTLQSDGGKLIFGGAVTVRRLNLFGDGDGQIQGNVSLEVPSGTPSPAIRKLGGGTWTLSGSQVIVGEDVNNPGQDLVVPILVEGGTLIVNSDATAATGDVSVGLGTGGPSTVMLGGNATLGGNVIILSDGVIAPGNPIGTLTALGDLGGDGALEIELDGAAADALTVEGSLDITYLDLDLSVINTPTLGTYVIVNASSPITGSQFASVTGIPAGYSLVYNHDDGTDSFNIALVNPSASTPFESWAGANGLAGADALPNADPDDDGLDNLIEFVLGGQPNPANPDANSSQLAPIVTEDDDNLVFTFRRTALSQTQPGIVSRAEYSPTLSGWTPAEDGVNGVSIVETTDHYGAGVDRVVVTIPKSLEIANKLFARMSVEIP